MKYLPLIALAVAISAHADSPPAGVQTIGQTHLAPKDVAQCVAHKWADKTQQQVVSQEILANDKAMDVYVPGQQPPDGAAAVVRPAYTGIGSWVGYRPGSGGAGADATADIDACL